MQRRCRVCGHISMEAREKKLRCVCMYSRAHTLYLAKTKDTSYDVAKVRDIRKGTGYQYVTLSIHGKSGDQNDK